MTATGRNRPRPPASPSPNETCVARGAAGGGDGMGAWRETERNLRPNSISYHMHCMSKRLLALSPSFVKRVTVLSASSRRSALQATSCRQHKSKHAILKLRGTLWIAMARIRSGIGREFCDISTRSLQMKFMGPPRTRRKQRELQPSRCELHHSRDARSC